MLKFWFMHNILLFLLNEMSLNQSINQSLVMKLIGF